MKKTALTVAAVLAIASSPSWAADATATSPLHAQVLERAIGETAVPAIRYSVNNQVSFADLDLANPTDTAILDGRIKDAALAACRQLAAQFPSSAYVVEPVDRSCVKTATAEGMAKAKTIAAAYASSKTVAVNN